MTIHKYWRDLLASDNTEIISRKGEIIFQHKTCGWLCFHDFEDNISINHPDVIKDIAFITGG